MSSTQKPQNHADLALHKKSPLQNHRPKRHSKELITVGAVTGILYHKPLQISI